MNWQSHEQHGPQALNKVYFHVGPSTRQLQQHLLCADHILTTGNYELL